MTGFTPVMDFFCLPSISQLPSHYPCSKNSPGFMPNCFWTGAKIKKRKASLKTCRAIFLKMRPAFFLSSDSDFKKISVSLQQFLKYKEK